MENEQQQHQTTTNIMVKEFMKERERPARNREWHSLISTAYIFVIHKQPKHPKRIYTVQMNKQSQDMHCFKRTFELTKSTHFRLQ